MQTIRRTFYTHLNSCTCDQSRNDIEITLQWPQFLLFATHKRTGIVIKYPDEQTVLINM